MNNRRRILFGALLFCTAAFNARPARADDADTQAAELKRRGDDLLDSKRFEEALAFYDRAYALKPSAPLLYNRGRALQFLARYPEALEAIRAFVREAPPEVRAKVPGLTELVTDLAARVTTVTFTCEVSGARVLLGGRQVGTCPFAAPVAVNAGHQSVEAIADGYLPWRRDFDLQGGGALKVTVTLAPRDTSGLLVIKSRVAGSRARVDGQELGVVPAESGLPAGDHEVEVVHAGYDPAKTRVVLRVGERKDITVDPVRQPPIYTKWWFWTGIAVVAAGTTAVVLAVTTEKSAPSGDFSPGTIRF